VRYDPDHFNVDHWARGPSVRIVSTCLVSFLLVGLSSVPAGAAEAAVRLNVGLVDSADAGAVLSGLGERVLGSEPVAGLRAVTVEVPAATAESVIADLTADRARVRYAEPDGTVNANAEYAGGHALNWAKVPAAWTWTPGRADVTVAVVDSGVTIGADLPAARMTAGYDFVDDDTDATDTDGHGTRVASVIAATRGNSVGIAGVCGVCGIMPVRVLRADGTNPAVGSIADAAAGIAWAADHGAEIVNASFSTTTASRLLEDAVNHAAAAGSLVVASAGNDVSTTRHYPAAYENALAVTKLNTSAPRNTASDRWIDVSALAPTQALNPDGMMVQFDGSSASAAIVAGVAALDLSSRPDASAADVRSAIRRTALRHPALPENHAPLIDAARLMSESGPADTVSPVIRRTGLLDGMYLQTAGQTVSADVTDDHGIERVEYRSGERLLGTLYMIGTAFRLTPPAGYNGSLPVTVTAYDYAGNTDTKTVTVQVDTSAPTGTIVTPTQDDALVKTQARVVVSASDDAVSVSHPRSGSLTRPIGSKEWAGIVTVVDGEISLTIRDRSGNATTIVRKVRVDDVKPTVAGVEPGEGAVVAGTFTTSLLGVSDLNGVAKAELWVGDKPGGVVTTAPYSRTVTAPSGPTVLKWQVTDTAGNVTEIQRTVRVDGDGPVAAAVTPAQSTRVRGAFTAGLSAVTDVSGYTEAELLVDGRSLGRDRTAPYAFRVPTGSYSGDVDLTWKLTDRFGNKRSYTRRVIADNAGPAVSITKAPGNRARVKGTVKVSVKAADASGVARVELLVNGKVVARDYKAGYLLSLNAGKQKRTMKIQVRAYDKLGNVKYTSTRIWYRK
jgi:hypothetical protein